TSAVSLICPYFILLIPRRPRSTLFPYTTLFRSGFREASGSDDAGLSTGARAGFGFEPGPGRSLHPQSGRCDARVSQRKETAGNRSEEHTSELQSRRDLVCRLLLEKKKTDGVHK